MQEAVAALQRQTYPLQQIVVVDNGSTDGTAEWLDAQQGLLAKHQQNLGGSGGFYTGLKVAASLDTEWIWVMDDDTICEPDTLQKLVQKIPQVPEKIGFIGSKSVWKDGSPHMMNIPAIQPRFNETLPFNLYDHLNLLLTETSSFVSLLINVNAVRKVGLPYREFFIWGDDQEYTRRITKAGYLGFYCTDSVVLHKTPINYFPDFYRDTAANLWKHKYGFRNEFFMVKKNKGFLYFICWLLAKVAYTSLKILKIRKDNHLKFIKTLLSSAWQSVFFNPHIDML